MGTLKEVIQALGLVAFTIWIFDLQGFLINLLILAFMLFGQFSFLFIWGGLIGFPFAVYHSIKNNEDSISTRLIVALFPLAVTTLAFLLSMYGAELMAWDLCRDSLKDYGMIESCSWDWTPFN